MKLEFDDELNKRELIGALILFVLYFFLLPYLVRLPEGLNDAQRELIRCGVSVLLCFVLLGGWLRRGFDRLCENFGLCLRCFLLAWVMSWFIAMLVGSIELSFMPAESENPNQEAIGSLLGADFGMTAAASIFLAPIVEECIFRGGLFCGIRPVNRIWAYAAASLVFSLCHILPFVTGTGDLRYLLFTLEYLPVGLVMCWCYEKSGSIWTSIFFHMSYNYLAVNALKLLDSML